MSTLYPGSIDAFQRPTATTPMNTPGLSHHEFDDNLCDAIEALESKVGQNSSAVTTTHDYKLSEITGSDKAVGKTATQTLTNKTLTSPTLNSPVITTPSGDIVSPSGSQTIQNKTLDNSNVITILDANLTVQDNVDPTKQARFQASGLTAATTRTLTLPDADTTLVGIDNTQTLTNKTLSTGSTLSGLADESFSLSSISRNGVLNGGMEVWLQSTSSAPNDDTYVASNVNFLTEANGAWTVARDTDVPTIGKGKYSMKFTNVTLNNQCAIVFFWENLDALRLFGRTVSFAFDAKTSGTEIAALRSTMLAWSSTADTITSDVIGTWASDGTDPTFATNWTKEKNGSNHTLTSSWQTFKNENIALDTASTTNLALVIWVDDGTIAANDDFWIDNVTLNVGATALPFQPRFESEERMLIERVLTPVIQADAGVAQADIFFVNRITAAITAVTVPIRRMRTTPSLVSTFTTYITTNPTSDGRYTFFDWSATAFLNNNSGTITITLNSIGPTFAVIRFTNSVSFSNGSINNLVSLELQGCALFLDARL